MTATKAEQLAEAKEERDRSIEALWAEHYRSHDAILVKYERARLAILAIEAKP